MQVRNAEKLILAGDIVQNLGTRDDAQARIDRWKDTPMVAADDEKNLELMAPGHVNFKLKESGEILSLTPDDVGVIVWGALARRDASDPFYAAAEAQRAHAIKYNFRQTLTHSYVVEIPRASGGVYAVMIAGSSDRFDEDTDNEAYCRDMVAGEIEDDEEPWAYPDDLMMTQATCKRLTKEETSDYRKRNPVTGSWG